MMGSLIILTGCYENMARQVTNVELQTMEVPTMATHSGEYMTTVGESYVARLQEQLEDIVVFTNIEQVFLGVRLGILKAGKEVADKVKAIYYPLEGPPEEEVSFNEFGNPSNWHNGMFDETSRATRKLILGQSDKRKAQKLAEAQKPLAAVPPNGKRPFNLVEWFEGADVVTRGGSTPVIKAFDKDYLAGEVDGATIVWYRDGTCTIRENYGYDLYLLSESDKS